MKALVICDIKKQPPPPKNPLFLYITTEFCQGGLQPGYYTWQRQLSSPTQSFLLSITEVLGGHMALARQRLHFCFPCFVTKFWLVSVRGNDACTLQGAVALQGKDIPSAFPLSPLCGLECRPGVRIWNSHLDHKREAMCC